METDHQTITVLSDDPTIGEAGAHYVATLECRAALGMAQKTARNGPAEFLRRKIGVLRDVPASTLTAEAIEQWVSTVAHAYTPSVAATARRSLISIINHARAHEVAFPALDPAGPPDGSVEAAARDWLDHLKARERDGDLGYRGHQDAAILLRRLGTLAALPVAALHPPVVRAWFAELCKTYHEPVARQAVKCLGRLLAHLRRIGETTGQPTHEIVPRTCKRMRKTEEAIDVATLTPLSPGATLQLVADHWLADKIEQETLGHLRPKSVRAYRYARTKLRERAQKPDHPGSERPALADFRAVDLAAADIDAWYKGLCASAGSAAAKACLARLRNLLRFARARGVIQCDPDYGVRAKHRRKPPRPVSADEMRVLRATAADLYDARMEDGRRRRLEGQDLAHHTAPHALFRMLLLSGTRIDEMACVDAGDIRGNKVKLLRTKSGKERRITIDDDAARVAAKQIELMFGKQGTWGPRVRGSLFATHEPESLKVAVWRVMREAVILAGLPKPWPHPHDLRHSFVHLSMEEGAPIDDIAWALGHDPKMTREIYGEGAERPGSNALSGRLAEATGGAI